MFLLLQFAPGDTVDAMMAQMGGGDAATARALRAQTQNTEDLGFLLGTKLINTVYSYGNAAPETLPAALVIVEACEGDLLRAVALANTLHKAADSLPAMVGAEGVARDDGLVFVRGELWQATTDDGDAIEPGTRVRVDEVRGLRLKVHRV